MKYLLIDSANLFFRAKHVVHRGADLDIKVGMAYHIMLNAVNKMHRDFDADHVVFCLEGRSWRKDFYEPYKKNRAVARAALTEAEQEEDAVFWEAYNELTAFLTEKTNCSVIRAPEAEGDDVIARWIALHPQDEHVIISSDTDFVQLLAENVVQYNGITEELITVDGIFDAKGKRVIDKKTKEPKAIPDPEWLLFEKCMRGDKSDNVFSAYPGVRKKGTKNKTGLLEAFEDRKTRGYAWNNLMLQRWIDHNEEEHRVIDDYNRNLTLIDLTKQPDNVKEHVDTAIKEQISHKHIGQVGIHFMRFCGKYELNKLSENATDMARWLNKSYEGVLNDNG